MCVHAYVCARMPMCVHVYMCVLCLSVSVYLSGECTHICECMEAKGQPQLLSLGVTQFVFNQDLSLASDSQ